MKRFILGIVAFAQSLFIRSEQVFSKLAPVACGNVYTNDYNILYVNAVPGKVSTGNQGGKVRIFRETYTQGAVAGAIGDVVYFGKLPKGAIPLPFGKIYFAAGTASATLKLGLAGNDACFVAATSIAAAGNAALDAFAANGATLGPLTADTDVIGTNAVAAIAATQAITVYIPYVMAD